MAAPVATAAAVPADGFCNVYVSSLPNSFTSGDLYKLFSPHGYLLSARCMQPKDKSATAPQCSIPNSDEHRGYGFVCFRDSLDAARAVQAMAGASVDGVRIQVRPSRRDVPSAAANVSWGDSSFGTTGTAPVLHIGSPPWQSGSPLMTAAAATTVGPTTLAAPPVSHPPPPQQQQQQQQHQLPQCTVMPSHQMPQHPTFVSTSFSPGASATFCHPPSSGLAMPSPTTFPSPLLGSGSSSFTTHYPLTATEGTPSVFSSSSSQLSPFIPIINHASGVSAPPHPPAPSPVYYISPGTSFVCTDSRQSNVIIGGAGGVPLPQPPQLHGAASVAPPMTYMDARFPGPPPPAGALPSTLLPQAPFNAYSHNY